MHRLGLKLWICGLTAWMAMASCEVEAASWTFTGSMPYELLIKNTATLLLNGKVLVTDGEGSEVKAALYNPATGTWASTASLPEAMMFQTATLLPSGKVLVMGVGGNTPTYSFSGVIYDPTTATWTGAGTMPAPWASGPTATLLPNGKVLIAGGLDNNGQTLSNAALYDPATKTWTAIGNMPVARQLHTATLLTNGKVLVAGGMSGNDASTTLASAALYDPATGKWTATGSMPDARFWHTATVLPNGKVLVAGGQNMSVLSTAALYDPATGKWTATSPLPDFPLEGHAATLLPNGNILVSGGSYNGAGSGLANAALYNPATSKWTATNSMNEPRVDHTATLLPNGKVLVAGGNRDATTELYTPDPAKLPDFTVTGITLIPASPALNTSFTAQITVKNQGTAASDGGKLAVWTGQGAAQACGAAGEQSAAVGTLAAGASKTLMLTGLKSATSGVKTFRAFVDSACATAESNEGNNQTALSYRVHGAQPDFVVKSVTLTPASPAAGKAFTASVTVANQGNAAGDAGYLDIWGNQPAAQPCEAEGDTWAAVGPLNAGASKTLTLNLVAGTAGAKTFRAFVNSWCGAGESDEGNNQQIQSYTVK